MKFNQLARELDKVYHHNYHLNRHKALQEFGIEREHDLREIVKSGRTLSELVNAAQIGGTEYFAEYIRDGMGVAAWRRESGVNRSDCDRQ